MPVFAAAHRRQQQVGDAVVEQVELIDVEHAAVGFGQQARLKHRRPAAREAATSTDPSSRSSVMPSGTCTKGAAHHLGGQQGGGIGPAGIAPQLGDALGGWPRPTPRGGAGSTWRRGGAWPQVEHVDRRQQGVQAPGQHRFARAPTPGDHHPAQARIHGRQQQGQLEGAVAGDGRQGEGAGGGGAGEELPVLLATMGEGRTLGSGSLADRIPWQDLGPDAPRPP